jgi:hypothetical protein
LPLYGGSNAVAPVSMPPGHAITSSTWRYKRPTANELKILVSLHQALVYGLSLKGAIGTSFLTPIVGTTGTKCDIIIPSFGCKAHSLPLAEPFQPSQDEEKPLYTQDAILARHLRTYLLANGIDAFRDALREINSGASDFNTAPRLAYRKVVASLIIRRHCSSNRSRARTPSRDNARPLRKPSRLSTSMNSD